MELLVFSFLFSVLLTPLSVLLAGRTRFVLHRKYSREIYLIQLYRTQFGRQY